MMMKMMEFLLLLACILTPSLALTKEGLHLLEAKKGLDDPLGSLSNWNPSDSSPCDWAGITCSTPLASSPPSVVSVDLPNLGLVGPFPAALCSLPAISFISLRENYINSSLPSAALAPCSALSHLDLFTNNLVGPLPPSLASLDRLQFLDLGFNNFSGPIPASFASFPRLEVLSLVNNLLSSPIPSFLSNLSSLRQLNLSYNPFAPSPIPASFGDLASLENLWLASCSFVGPIPDSLGRLSLLTNLDLSTNNLTGSIPASIANLTSLVQIELYENSLSGVFPSGLSKIGSLLRIDASMNRLEGPIPDDLFDVPNLQSLHLYSNYLTGEISPSISKLKGLVEVRLFDNRLSGTLPADLGKNSPLVTVDLSYNNLTGEIPSGICDGGALEEVLLIGNELSGGIPAGLGRCRSLRRVRLSRNRLSGKVPDGLWGLPHVGLLDLADNSLSGEISALVLGAGNLSALLISDNDFTGSIPSEVGSLWKLYELSAANNRLAGPLPSAMTNLGELGRLDLHNNSLSGEILTGIIGWKKLAELNLADNDFTGEIPTELGDLPVLNYLDLSGNLLTGKIPLELQNLKLNRFNLSNNQLSGPLPPMFANDNYVASLLNNPGLCGELTGICPGPAGDSRSHRVAWLIKTIFMVAAMVLVVGLGWFYLKYRKFKKAKLSDKSKWTLTSFHKLGFSEYEILDCLDEDNVVGSGASGKVYKAVLSSGEAVAVKKLWGDPKDVDGAGDGSFEAEVATLGKIRHKNIVRLWCSCTHKDCKLLVYEYMPNGSLGDLLHGKKGGALDWPTRFKVAVDAAEGLAYLHHDSVPPIVHRDVKSNNILLDSDFGARVADFGVAKAVDAAGKGAQSMSVIAGSCGYIAPEYAYTLRVTEKSDIYSYGVVILELVTGRRPIDPEFGEKDLVKWVCSTLEQKGLDHVLDQNLDVALHKEEINKVLNIGLMCTSNLPMNRPSMRRVVKMLLEVRPDEGKHKPKKQQQDEGGKLSPYYYDDASYQGSIV